MVYGLDIDLAGSPLNAMWCGRSRCPHLETRSAHPTHPSFIWCTVGCCCYIFGTYLHLANSWSALPLPRLLLLCALHLPTLFLPPLRLSINHPSSAQTNPNVSSGRNASGSSTLCRETGLATIALSMTTRCLLLPRRAKPRTAVSGNGRPANPRTRTPNVDSTATVTLDTAP